MRGGQWRCLFVRPMVNIEHQESYLKAILGFIGLTDITFVHAEGAALGLWRI
jgi:FMN-dependent NADH-azoreductase